MRQTMRQTMFVHYGMVPLILLVQAVGLSVVLFMMEIISHRCPDFSLAVHRQAFLVVVLLKILMASVHMVSVHMDPLNLVGETVVVVMVYVMGILMVAEVVEQVVYFLLVQIISSHLCLMVA